MEAMLRETLTMTTFSGRLVRILDPRPEDLHFEDIVQGLAHSCRYAGQVRRFYSVAEHSIWCALAAMEMYPGDVELAQACLMHDAAEAYIGDLIWPMKAALRNAAASSTSAFDDIESRFNVALQVRFGLMADFANEWRVKMIDQRACSMEQIAIRTKPIGWEPHVPPLDFHLDKLSTIFDKPGAQLKFVSMARDLGVIE